MASKCCSPLAAAGVLVAALLSAQCIQAQDYYLDKVWNTPDYTQTDSAYGGFPDDEGVLHGGYFCGPTAGSNSLMWLADHGFENLASDSGDRKKDQHDLIADIAGPDYMDAYENNGTGITNFCKGFKNWIHDHGYEYERLLFQGYCTCDAEYYAGTAFPDLDWAREALRGETTGVILNVGWFAYDEETDNYDEIGGHYMTLVGYGHDGVDYNPDYLIAHDPAPRAGTSFGNNYALPEMITSGTLNGYRNAAGYYKLTDGIVVKDGADFCILRGVIVLEMTPHNSVPVAQDDSYSCDEDTSIVRYEYEGVLINDSDADEDPLEAVKVSAPLHGTLTLDSTGWLVYTPNPNYHGSDAFTYRAYDGQAYSDLATVTLEIASVNDVPVAADDDFEMKAGSMLVKYAWEGLLVNDSDLDNEDGDPTNDVKLKAVLESGPSHGVYTPYAEGSFKYVPNAGFYGTDSFTYRAFDGEAYSELATVWIDVLSPFVVPGDATGDGKVDSADAAVLAANWGEAVSGASMGDFDGDGFVGPADAAIMAAHWGDHNEATPVPEPALLGLLLSASLALFSLKTRDCQKML